MKQARKKKEDPGIIKENNPKIIRFFWIAGIALVLVPVLIIFIYAAPPERRPDWAPEGCSVFRRIDDGRKQLVIEILELENFDTDREAAAAIIAAYDNEKEWFDTNNSYQFPVEIQLHYPNRSWARNPILYYQKQLVPTRLERLRFTQIPQRYNNEEITIPELREVAAGDHELGLMDIYFQR